MGGMTFGDLLDAGPLFSNISGSQSQSIAAALAALTGSLTVADATYYPGKMYYIGSEGDWYPLSLPAAPCTPSNRLHSAVDRICAKGRALLR